MGHDYGLFWLKQGKGPERRADLDQARRSTSSIASVHTLLWADLDGDGKDDELVTGKRVYAHEVEPGATDGSVDRLVSLRPRGRTAWTKHVIFQGEPAKNAPAKGADATP